MRWNLTPQKRIRAAKRMGTRCARQGCLGQIDRADRPSTSSDARSCGGLQGWAARGRRTPARGRRRTPIAADIDGEGPLHAAARWGQVAVVEMPALARSRPGAKALYGMTPLQLSIEQAQLGRRPRAVETRSGCECPRLVWQVCRCMTLPCAATRAGRPACWTTAPMPGQPTTAGRRRCTLRHAAASTATVQALLAHGANPSGAELGRSHTI